MLVLALAAMVYSLWPMPFGCDGYALWPICLLAYALWLCLMAYALRVGVDDGSDVGVAVGVSDGAKVGCSVATVGLADGGLVGRT